MAYAYSLVPLPDDSQIEEPMTSFFLNQDRYDASQGEDSPAPAPPPRRGRQLTAMERKAESASACLALYSRARAPRFFASAHPDCLSTHTAVAKQMMKNGMNLNQAVSAVLAADKEGVDGKGAAEPPEGDDDVFQSEEVIAHRGINLHVIDTLLFVLLPQAMVYAGYKPQIPIFCTHPGTPNRETRELREEVVYERLIVLTYFWCVSAPWAANIVEAATLASAQPPEPTYKPKLPPACTENGEKSLLSTLQYVRRPSLRTSASVCAVSPNSCFAVHRRKPW